MSDADEAAGGLASLLSERIESALSSEAEPPPPPPPLPPVPMRPPPPPEAFIVRGGAEPGARVTLVRRRAKKPRYIDETRRVEPTLEAPAPKTAVARAPTPLRAHLAAARLYIEDRWGPTLTAAYRHRVGVLGGVCGVLVVYWLALAVAARVYAPAGRTFIETGGGPFTYARHGVHGVDLSRRSSALTCAELADGTIVPAHDGEEPSLARVRASAEFLLERDGKPCLCAPALRLWRRYLALALPASDDGGAASIVHAYNPVLDADWRGEMPDGVPPLDVSEWRVRENQRHLFPSANGSVDVVRRRAVRLVYRTTACRTESLVLEGTYAWCAQACADLLEGRSVYEVAAQ